MMAMEMSLVTLLSSKVSRAGEQYYFHAGYFIHDAERVEADKFYHL
jgi:hypothetical protein